MNTNMLRLMIMIALPGAAILSGCAPKKPVSSEGVAIEKTLQQAETDARSGKEKKALEEIDSAEKALIEEDKKKPYVQGIKTESGINPKAAADQDAIKELKRAKRDASGNLAGDAADDIDKALKDVKVKEGN